MKVRWDDRDAKTAYANVCGAAIAPEEITLRFGMKQGEDAARREVMVALSHSVVLNPMTAKRLALILEQVPERADAGQPTLVDENSRPGVEQQDALQAEHLLGGQVVTRPACRLLQADGAGLEEAQALGS